MAHGSGIGNFSVKSQSPTQTAFINPDPYAGMGDWVGPGGGAYPGSSYSTVGMGGMGVGYNPAIVAAGAPGATTGNEFVGGVPAYAPQPFDAPIQQPTMFNMQPYVETFNAGWPTPMNPGFNLDALASQAPPQSLWQQFLGALVTPNAFAPHRGRDR